MKVVTEKVVVVLRPFSKDEVAKFVPYFNSMAVHKYTMGMFAQTIENEHEWYEKNRQDKTSATWAIVTEGESEPVGITSLHHLDDYFGACSSGIIIFKREWWGKGVASASHLARTMCAADYLGRIVINSQVRSENLGSKRALERIGYTVWGTDPITIQRGGKWLATDSLKWFHPERKTIFFPEGVPDKYLECLDRAKISLDKARQVVSFI